MCSSDLLLVRENNNQGDISKSTDYYILDIEYTDYSDRSKSRFDIVALKWESKSWIRKDNGKCFVVLMEMKYGDNALDGAAGIEKHLEDFKNFFAKPVYELKEIYKDWEKVFKQKCELGLVDGLQEKQYDVKIEFNEPEVALIYPKQASAIPLLPHRLPYTILKKFFGNRIANITAKIFSR